LIYGDIAEVFDSIAKRGEAPIEIGYAHGGGAHVHAAAVLSQVEGGADNRDVGLAHGES